MSRRPPSPEQLEALRDSFRRSPPSSARDFKAAAKLAGVTEHQARTAYTRGWPGVVDPIETQLARERALQAKNAEVLRAERIVHTMKTNAVILLNEMHRLVPAVKALTDNLIGGLADIAGLHPETAAKLLQRVTKVHRDVAAISTKAVELDRLIAGEATSIVGHKPIAAEPVDLEETQALSDRLARAVRRAQDTNEPNAEPDAVDTHHVN